MARIWNNNFMNYLRRIIMALKNKNQSMSLSAESVLKVESQMIQSTKGIDE